MSEPDDTASRLVTAAERLFAEGGEEATSLRAIARAAHANAAAVHYHFGGRDELARAVLQRQLGPLTTRRLQALDALISGSSASRLSVNSTVPTWSARDVLVVILRPDLELLAKLRKKRVGLARFIGRASATESLVVRRFLDEQFEAVASRAVPMLRVGHPEVSDAECRLRLGMVMAVVASAFAAAPDPGQPGPFGSNDVATQLDRLVTFSHGGLAASAVAGGESGKRRKR